MGRKGRAVVEYNSTQPNPGQGKQRGHSWAGLFLTQPTND